MRQLIAGNWKMHMLRAAGDRRWPGRARRRPGPGVRSAGLSAVHRDRDRWRARWRARPSRSAARTATPQGQGAHTGDVSAAMLRDAGATWVILGHSERRQNHGETDELVREKVLAAVEAGLTPIVCVGETEEQRACGPGDRGGGLAARRQPAQAVRRRGGL